MTLRQYQIDAFTDRVFRGNPAAVVPLSEWLDDDVLQAIAMENNLSETAFFARTQAGYHLRWFTPVTEVDLCGHATLATAHVIFDILGSTEPVLTFQTRSGDLTVVRAGDLLKMDFPAVAARPCEPPPALLAGLGAIPGEVLAGDDYIAVYDGEPTIRAINPDFTRLSELDRRGVIVTAIGTDVDFVSRFFAPKYGIPEDPVTGSAHCALAPYWSSRLGRCSLAARQVSRRGGDIACEVHGERVVLSGRAITFMEGEISIGR